MASIDSLDTGHGNFTTASTHQSDKQINAITKLVSRKPWPVRVITPAEMDKKK